MPRPIWSGAISLGLVTVPVKRTRSSRAASSPTVDTSSSSPTSLDQLCPDGDTATRPSRLLLEAHDRTSHAGSTRFVMRGNEQLAALRCRDGARRGVRRRDDAGDEVLDLTAALEATLADRGGAAAPETDDLDA